MGQMVRYTSFLEFMVANLVQETENIEVVDQSQDSTARYMMRYDVYLFFLLQYYTAGNITQEMYDQIILNIINRQELFVCAYENGLIISFPYPEDVDFDDIYVTFGHLLSTETDKHIIDVSDYITDQTLKGLFVDFAFLNPVKDRGYEEFLDLYLKASPIDDNTKETVRTHFSYVFSDAKKNCENSKSSNPRIREQIFCS